MFSVREAGTAAMEMAAAEMAARALAVATSRSV